jgi:hypothetical protein
MVYPLYDKLCSYNPTNSEESPAMRKTFLLSVTTLVVMTLVALASYGFRHSKAPELPKSPAIDYEKLNPIQISKDNSLGSLLFIQEATTKQASNGEYEMLTGSQSGFAANSTYPDVSLINHSSKTIKSFALIVQSAADRPQSGHIILKNNLSIAPNETYKVASSAWARSEKETIERDGKLVTVARKPGLNSPGAWLPGAAADLRVTVGLVEYDDNTRWKIPTYSNW